MSHVMKSVPLNVACYNPPGLLKATLHAIACDIWLLSVVLSCYCQCERLAWAVLP